jgi:hypothetical protein
MTTHSLKSSRERSDRRSDGDNAACLRSASSWALKASSISSPQGSRTRLLSFFMKFSGTGHCPPNGPTVHIRSNIAHATWFSRTARRRRTRGRLSDHHSRSARANTSRRFAWFAAKIPPLQDRMNTISRSRYTHRTRLMSIVGGPTWKRCERPLLIACSANRSQRYPRRRMAGRVRVRRVTESISNPRFCEDVIRMGWIVFNLLTKSLDVRS